MADENLFLLHLLEEKSQVGKIEDKVDIGRWCRVARAGTGGNFEYQFGIRYYGHNQKGNIKFSGTESQPNRKRIVRLFGD